MQINLGCFPPFLTWFFFSHPPFPHFTMKTFTHPPTLPPLPMIYFPWNPPLPNLPLNYPSLYLPNCLNLYALDFFSFAFAFVLSGIKPAQHCIHYFSSSVEVMFSENIFCRDCLAEEVTFPQCSTKIMILRVREWEKSSSITFNHVQNFSQPRSKTNCAIWLYLTLVPPSCMHGTC